MGLRLRGTVSWRYRLRQRPVKQPFPALRENLDEKRDEEPRDHARDDERRDLLRPRLHRNAM